MLITASSKTLSFFNKDTRGEVQTVTFDTDEVKALFYGSFLLSLILSLYIQIVYLIIYFWPQKNLNFYYVLVVIVDV